ncbi:hypothetical protein [Mucilaginibacter aquariorum]|uniref:DUF4348 domain-containing protein n=1 Tax=Mucilaginibacter aquariorum TaxID=2967225 RepID=A0ABT1T897_9SPHI|nr:hypothetical protein [Mucilaginibacter aquariorum]MCQ6960843.1 hypothetical protein [Mucilaginibacter aquariorum]
MKNILIAGFLTLVETVYPNQSRPVKIPPRFENYLTSKDNARRAFFKFDKNRDSYLFNKTSCQYDLSNDDVLRIEKLISKRVTAYNKTANSTIKQPEKYYKQFVAIINTKREKEVWVNCCCSVQNTWKTKIQFVEDGGTCYFQIKINLTKNRINSFMTNGLA